MATLDLRPDSMKEEGAEVKEPETGVEETEVEGGEGAEGESSTPEETQETEATEEAEEPTEETEETVGSEETSNDEEIELNALEEQKKKLLAEIVELRGDRRELRHKKEDQPLFTEAKDELKDVAPDDIALIEKVLRSKGYVQKSELETLTYKQQMDKYKDEWLDQHPEYKPENDPNDEKWNALNGTVSSYFKSPANPKEVRKILDLAHHMVAPEKKLPIRSRADADIAKKKLTVSSKGDGGGTKAPAVKPQKSTVDRSYLKGFTDEEAEELFG